MARRVLTPLNLAVPPCTARIGCARSSSVLHALHTTLRKHPPSHLKEFGGFHCAQSNLQLFLYPMNGAELNTLSKS